MIKSHYSFGMRLSSRHRKCTPSCQASGAGAAQPCPRLCSQGPAHSSAVHSAHLHGTHQPQAARCCCCGHPAHFPCCPHCLAKADYTSSCRHQGMAACWPPLSQQCGRHTQQLCFLQAGFSYWRKQRAGSPLLQPKTDRRSHRSWFCLLLRLNLTLAGRSFSKGLYTQTSEAYDFSDG